MKCTGETPACDRCSKLGKTCEYLERAPPLQVTARHLQSDSELTPRLELCGRPSLLGTYLLYHVLSHISSMVDTHHLPQVVDNLLVTPGTPMGAMQRWMETTISRATLTLPLSKIELDHQPTASPTFPSAHSSYVRSPQPQSYFQHHHLEKHTLARSKLRLPLQSM